LDRLLDIGTLRPLLDEDARESARVAYTGSTTQVRIRPRRASRPKQLQRQKRHVSFVISLLSSLRNVGVVGIRNGHCGVSRFVGWSRSRRRTGRRRNLSSTRDGVLGDLPGPLRDGRETKKTTNDDERRLDQSSSFISGFGDGGGPEAILVDREPRLHSDNATIRGREYPFPIPNFFCAGDLFLEMPRRPSSSSSAGAREDSVRTSRRPRRNSATTLSGDFRFRPSSKSTLDGPI